MNGSVILISKFQAVIMGNTSTEKEFRLLGTMAQNTQIPVLKQITEGESGAAEILRYWA